MDSLLAASATEYYLQRTRGTASLQAPSLLLAESYFLSIHVLPTRRAAQNRFSKYQFFCTSVDVPAFPLVGPIVALSLASLSEASTTSPAYDSHASVLNAVRRATSPLWNPSLSHSSSPSSDSLMSYKPLYEFVTHARKAAGSAKRGRAIEELSSPSSSSRGTRSGSQRGMSGTPGLESEVGTPTPSTPIGKRRRVERGSSVASSLAESTTESGGGTPRKRGGTVRQVKMLEKQELAREKVGGTPTRTPIARKVKEEARTPGKQREARTPSKRVPVVEVEVTVGRGQRMEARKRKLEVVAMEVDDESLDSEDKLIVTKIVEEEEDIDEVEIVKVVEEEPVQEVEEVEMGMFGRIVKWFGLGS